MRILAVAAAAVAATVAWSSAGAVDVQIHGFEFGCVTPDGERRKPKFGDVDGIYFTNLPAEQKPCLETIDRMIYSCTANTTFISHDLNDRFPGCLRIFERQASRCVRHFEQERQKCYAGDTLPPAETTAESDEPEVEPADLTMWAAKRSNIRSGPGTDHAKVGLLEIGDEVQVTGEIGDWLRIEAPGGGAAFVWAPLLTEEAPKRVTAATERDSPSGIETARTSGIPDRATRNRVADRLERCNRLWHLGLWRSGVQDYDLVEEHEQERFLRDLKEIQADRAVVADAREYIEMCVPMDVMIRDEGLPCRQLAYEIWSSISGTTAEIVRNAEEYLDERRLSRAQTNIVEDYLRTCATAYATVIDGGSVASISQAKDKRTAVATTAPAPDSGRSVGSGGTQGDANTVSRETAESSSRKASGAAAASASRIPENATHCVKLHVEAGVPEYLEAHTNQGLHYRYKVVRQAYENTCSRAVVVRVRHFAKYPKYLSLGHSYISDFLYPAKFKPDHWSEGFVLQVNNTEFSDHRMQTEYPPPPEVAYCAEFVDTDITPEYLHEGRYRVSYDTGTVDQLRTQGVKVGPEMRAYYDAYLESLKHSPCYAEVVSEPPIGYEHFSPIERYEISRMSTYIIFDERGGGFDTTSFDEKADFGGANFHDVGGTETHYISDLPKPSAGRN